MPQIPALRLFLAPNRQILGVQKRGKGGFITQAISDTFRFRSRIDKTRLVFGSWGVGLAVLSHQLSGIFAFFSGT
jgi:hypothetical protein